MISDQCKKCRRLGQKLFLKGERCFSAKCALTRRAYAPGPQRKRKGGNASEYKKSLVEKQMLKRWYGLSEKQFKRYVEETLAKMGKVDDVSAELIRNLEKRLDNAVYRAGFAKNRAMARQMVSHGFFAVNGKNVNIPSFIIEKDDIISIKESKKKKPLLKEVAEQLKQREIPVWLTTNIEKLQTTAIGEPSLDEVKPPAEISLIFEFYSR